MKTQKPTCYLICGFLGAGKTTYSKKLAQETNAVHLNADEWCMKLFSKEEYEKNWENCFLKTMDYLWKQAAELFQQKKSVILDIGFWTMQERHNAYTQAIQLGFEPIIHYIYAPDNILKNRISQRTGAIADYNLIHFDEIKKKFEEPNNSENYIKINNI